jgi:hypothetical protein
MPANVAFVRTVEPKAVSSAFSVMGIPLVVWALALLLVGATSYLNPPAVGMNAIELVVAF